MTWFRWRCTASCGWQMRCIFGAMPGRCCFLRVTQRKLQTPGTAEEHTKDRKHLQSNHPTVNQHTAQTKHQALSKGQPGRRTTPITTAAVHTASQQPAIITRTQQTSLCNTVSAPRHPPPHPRLGHAFYPPWHPSSSPTCRLRLSSATHPGGRGRCRTIRSRRSRRGLSSSCSLCGQCRRCAQRGSGHHTASRIPSPRTQPPAPTGAATAAAHSGAATGTTRLPPRSQRDPQRGDLLLYLPGRPVVVDVCVTHPLASSAVAASAWRTGVSAEANRRVPICPPVP